MFIYIVACEQGFSPVKAMPKHEYVQAKVNINAEDRKLPREQVKAIKAWLAQSRAYDTTINDVLHKDFDKPRPVLVSTNSPFIVQAVLDWAEEQGDVFAGVKYFVQKTRTTLKEVHSQYFHHHFKAPFNYAR